ncbi:hypothetical protein KEM56_003495 [Ascosphaera pollenicola]|nr:hypothetical protein KEM56_003495 [Ascosphaera pollenicola]
MAAQEALVTETIVNLKRALGHWERDVNQFPDEPVAKRSNRGIKLSQGSEYIREGALGPSQGRQYFRKRAKHAGYERDIQEFNAAVYENDEDEVGNNDETRADNALNEDVPFEDIRFESLLCPLRHPSELEHHPSMSEPYRSKALKHMIRSIDERLQRERTVLHKAKRLHREFVGDVPWMPCGFLETPQDYSMFIPRWAARRNGPPATQLESRGNHSIETQDVRMKDHPDEDGSRAAQTDTEGNRASRGTIGPGFLGKDTSGSVHPMHEEAADTTDKPLNSVFKRDGVQWPAAEKLRKAPDNDTQDPSCSGLPSENEPPRRMTTRARVGTSDVQDTPGLIHADDDGDAADTSFMVHPLYTAPIPPVDHACGLPPPEADEMRRALWSFIQKQDETVRGFDKMLTMLLKSNRMKDNVWEWCKAEAHLGELSDGEDWPDYERWGLEVGDLKKGADTDEEVPEEKPTKRGRGRRT